MAVEAQLSPPSISVLTTQADKNSQADKISFAVQNFWQVAGANE